MLDLLLSIPILSYVFFPTTGASISTSVNIIFFYMTWTSLVFSHPALELHLSGVVVVRVIFWLIPSLVFLLFDAGFPGLAEGFKLGGRSALPTRDARKLAKMLALALLNVLACLASEAAVSVAYTLLFKRHVFRMSTTLPLPWTIFRHCLFIFASRELLNFYTHRYVLHGSSWLARKHMAFAHANAGAPFSLQAFTDYPLATLLHRCLPVLLPSVLIHTHMLTYFLVLIITSIEETLAMSGYTVVPGIIMSGIAQRTAIHYAGKGASNFGAYGVLDWAHSTSQGRGVLDDVRQEADKHHVQEKSANKVDHGAKTVHEGVDSLKKRLARSKNDE
ncbi:Sterol desaturase family [Metarhizium album ARSEF 1941]|uniref:Sterol desaturase family n=1 Tax=Metarhizium album (strain ARSEF 1941) TaxID=1081103 RepID=A0A0B2WKB7_METAS|nr:Sterol desaturase family [Metarhizium album ARSEF 1941]KHN94119.1 Sterol desaturase family [Metarhizium album ARSEF 1941]